MDSRIRGNDKHLPILHFSATFPRPPHSAATLTTPGVNVKLPIPTTIPLDVLNKRIEEVFSFSVRTANCLQNAGMDHVWQLLAQSEASMFKTKDCGQKTLDEICEKLAEKGWKLGTLLSYGSPLLEVIYWKTRSHRVTGVTVVGLDANMFDLEHPDVLRFLAEHGLHANMTIDELFVYVPTERPPLTEEQVAFLSQWPRDVFTAADELAWHHMYASNTVRNRVFDIAVLLPHLRSDDVHKDVIARIRARIEAEVGPLPLALSSEELRHFFR